MGSAIMIILGIRLSKRKWKFSPYLSEKFK